MTAADEIQNGIMAIQQGIPDMDAYATYDEKSGTIHLTDLRVARKARRGTGTRYMEELCDFADANDLIITLTPGQTERSDGSIWKSTTSQNRLIRFYRRFGFKMKSKLGRYDLRGMMARIPISKARKAIRETRKTLFGSEDDPRPASGWLDRSGTWYPLTFGATHDDEIRGILGDEKLGELAISRGINPKAQRVLGKMDQDFDYAVTLAIEMGWIHKHHLVLFSQSY